MSHRVGHRSSAAHRAQARRNAQANRAAPRQQQPAARRQDAFETQQRRGPNLDGTVAPRRRSTRERLAAYSDRQLAARERKVKKGIKSAVKNKRKKTAARLKAELKLIDREQHTRMKQKIANEVKNISVGIDTKSQAWQTLDQLSPEEMARGNQITAGINTNSAAWQSLDAEEVANAHVPEWSPMSDAEVSTWLQENGFGTADEPNISDAELAKWDAEADLMSDFAKLFPDQL